MPSQARSTRSSALIATMPALYHIQIMQDVHALQPGEEELL